MSGSAGHRNPILRWSNASNPVGGVSGGTGGQGGLLFRGRFDLAVRIAKHTEIVGFHFFPLSPLGGEGSARNAKQPPHPQPLSPGGGRGFTDRLSGRGTHHHETRSL